ncbi:very short patch repair endonuclease [Flavobacterium sp.]|uniref:very short patch repair endonuclease n=1 Tax=Flavobacterium sp. TaxID=239 RepID=UPI003D6BBF0E
MEKQYNIETIKVPRFNEASGFYTTPERSKLMSKIRAKNTKPEIKLRKELWRLGFRYRKYVKHLPGNPDIVIKKYNLVIFVDGEFWHGHNWNDRKAKIKSNRDFWIPKIERNMQRDNENNFKIEALGYRVFRFWERQINKDLSECIDKLRFYIESI